MSLKYDFFVLRRICCSAYFACEMMSELLGIRFSGNLEVLMQRLVFKIHCWL